MKEVRSCKVLDVREFRKNDNYLYHIILKDLNANERFDIRTNEVNQIYCYKNKYDVYAYNYNLLIKGDIIDIIYDNRDNSIEFKIL